jgi:phenylacetate-CoA ligase
MESLTPRKEDLEPIEYASRDAIPALQLKRMKQAIRHACENSPFFRKRFDETGVHPNDLNSLSDLSKFPFTYKRDLRDTYPFGIFAVPIARSEGKASVWWTTGRRNNGRGPEVFLRPRLVARTCHVQLLTVTD